MRERGILFSAPMVRAILDGSKAQTRRIVKLPSEHMDALCGFEAHYNSATPTWSGGADGRGGVVWENDRCRSFVPARCPYGAVGDRLWVRETWCLANPEYSYPRPDNRPIHDDRWCYYAATDPDVVGEGERKDGSERSPWRPSIFMPRWASRITLDVTGVRVERLQAITEADAKAEGAPVDDSPCDHPRVGCDEIGCMGQTHRAGFCDLWCRINGIDSWRANPWVWVVEFKVVAP
jgi:hypothetical protein